MNRADNRQRAAARWRFIFLVSTGTLLALAFVAWAGGVSPLERALYDWLTAEASPATVAVFKWINLLGNWAFLLPATVLLLLVIPDALRRRWWLWGGVMVGAPILEDAAKLVVGRPRPEGFSMGFPSGHVTAAAAFFVMATYLVETSRAGFQTKILCWAGAALFIILVGIARIMLHAHWPLDAAGGAALGVACAAAAAWWNERHRGDVISSEAP